MKNVMKAVSYFVMLVSLGAVLLFVAPPVDKVTAEEAKAKPVVTIGFSGLAGPGLLDLEVHQQAYLSYLVNEYVPEAINDWSSAFAERGRVTAELPEKKILFKAIPAPEDAGVVRYRVESDMTGEYGVAESVYGAVGEGVVIKFRDVGEDIPELKDGIRIETLDQGRVDDKDVFVYKAEKLLLDEKHLEEMNARVELYKAFESAVELKDATRIKELLPEILEDYKAVTEKLFKIKEEIARNQ